MKLFSFFVDFFKKICMTRASFSVETRIRGLIRCQPLSVPVTPLHSRPVYLQPTHPSTYLRYRLFVAIFAGSSVRSHNFRLMLLIVLLMVLLVVLLIILLGLMMFLFVLNFLVIFHVKLPFFVFEFFFFDLFTLFDFFILFLFFLFFIFLLLFFFYIFFFLFLFVLDF